MKITSQGCVNGLWMLWWRFSERVDQIRRRCDKTGMDPLDAFVPGLGKAGGCKYLLNCGCGRKISYSEHILQDIVVQGLVDSEIWLDLLSDINQNMTLEEVFQFVEKKESGKRSANHLLEFQASEYEKQGLATIAHLATRFRGYRLVKSCMSPTK